MDNEALAREHFEAIEHTGGLVAFYWINHREFLVIARPPHGSGHRLSTTVSLEKVDGKITEYVRSVGTNFSYADLLIKEFEVFEGEVV